MERETVKERESCRVGRERKLSPLRGREMRSWRERETVGCFTLIVDSSNFLYYHWSKAMLKKTNYYHTEWLLFETQATRQRKCLGVRSD